MSNRVHAPSQMLGLATALASVNVLPWNLILHFRRHKLKWV